MSRGTEGVRAGCREHGPVPCHPHNVIADSSHRRFRADHVSALPDARTPEDEAERVLVGARSIKHLRHLPPMRQLLMRTADRVG